MQRSYFIPVVIVLLALLFVTSSCEDVVTVDLQEGASQMVVDAIITDSPGAQEIRITRSSSYFNNALPAGISGAQVRVTDLLGRSFLFAETSEPGLYRWNPDPSSPLPFGIAGNVYSLSIVHEGEEYLSSAAMDSVLSIDSLWTEFREQSVQGPDTIPSGYVLGMKAVDLPGEGNAYWFRTYRNGKRYNAPAEINLAYDAAFGPGSDGVEVIAPIVFALSPERFSVGDSIQVECLSIGLPAYYFLSLARTQMTNSGLFAEPPSNVPTNVVAVRKDAPSALGWFIAASVTRKGIRVKP